MSIEISLWVIVAILIMLPYSIKCIFIKPFKWKTRTCFSCAWNDKEKSKCIKYPNRYTNLIKDRRPACPDYIEKAEDNE